MVTGVRSRAARNWSTAFGYANVLPFVFFALFPLYYMLITSLKNDAELYNLKAIPFLIQTGVITDHYRYLFFQTEFLTWMKNSLIISVVSTSVSLVIAILAGYSLARLRFRGAASFGTAVFITYPVPRPRSSCPLPSRGVAGPVGHHPGAHRHHPTFLVPFSTWCSWPLPNDSPQEECALVDGASRMQTLVKISAAAILGAVCAALFGFTSPERIYLRADLRLADRLQDGGGGVTMDLIGISLPGP
jgi:multiple sugar transport system permease protein